MLVLFIKVHFNWQLLLGPVKKAKSLIDECEGWQACAQELDNQLSPNHILYFYFLFPYIINPPPRNGEGIIGMHFVCPSVCPSVTFRVRAITYICIDGLPSHLVQMLSSLRRCALILTWILISKVKVHMRHLKVRVHMLSNLYLS